MKRIEDLAEGSELVACKAISNGALSSDKLPSRIKLLNWGKNETVKGPVIFDDHSVAQLAVNQRALGFDRIALDYEHNTVPGSEEFKRTKEPRDVAAYGVPETVAGDGLYLNSIEWTPSGLASARNFADLSPTPLLDKSRRVVFLQSVALVRNGAVHDLSFFSAAPGGKSTNTDTDMTPEQIQALITNALTAAVKTLNDQIVALSAELKTIKETKPPEPVLTLTAADGKTSTMPLNTLAVEFVTLKSQLEATQNAAVNAERAALVNRFSAEGKVPLGENSEPLTIEQLSAKSLDVLKMLLANTASTVPLSARGKAPGEKKSTDGLTGLQRAIAAHASERN